MGKQGGTKRAADEVIEGTEATIDEAIYTAQAMVTHGGSFVAALGKALFHADMENTIKIKQAFPEYWERYRRLAEKESE